MTCWEVKRFRLDDEGMWTYKGTSLVTDPLDLLHKSCVIRDLQNNHQYRFCVAGRNSTGLGFDSGCSDPIFVEKALPGGWFRFWDARLKRSYYSNIKTKQTSWDRPESDPRFLDESIVLIFTAAELAFLTELFDEEIAHFGRVTEHGK